MKNYKKIIKIKKVFDIDGNNVFNIVIIKKENGVLDLSKIR